MAMIFLNSPKHRELRSALEKSIEDGNSDKWANDLKKDRRGVQDGFLVLMDYFNSRDITSKQLIKLDAQLLNADPSCQKAFDLLEEVDVESSIFYGVWQILYNSVVELLRGAKLMGKIPPSGGALVFLGGLSKCLIIRYEIIYETPKWDVVEIIQYPKSSFDFWGAIDQADMTARNHLKSILSTGQKIIIHRGILNHVDRRHDAGVFGPSIDTLVLSEILTQQAFEIESNQIKTAMEVGCGNGLVTTHLANYCSGLEELFAIDIDPNAIFCTSKNVLSSPLFRKSLTKPSTYFIIGEFHKNLISRKFDLLVCNPPYIPFYPSRNTKTNNVANYFKAVGGTDLLQTLVSSASGLLKPGGKMLLMSSNLSPDDVPSWVPESCTFSRPLGEEGFEVLFDVEAVLNDKNWLSFLLDERGLNLRDGLYYHTLHPIWIENSGGR